MQYGRMLVTAASALATVLAWCPSGHAQSAPTLQEAYLKASNTEAHDWFGRAVAASGDTVVVGAPHESSGATGVNGDQGNNDSHSSGAAYVFLRDGSDWVQQAYLKASIHMSQAQFGGAVAIEGDTIAVGAAREPFGDGEVFVFVRSGTTWTEQARLAAPDPVGEGNFGASVSISGDTLCVGEPWGKSASDYSGAAHIFVRNGSIWTHKVTLGAFNGEDFDDFGRSVSVSGDIVVVGAPSESSKATGVDGDSLDNSYGGCGAAYVFVRTGTLWFNGPYLKPSKSAPSLKFGSSVAASGNTVVVGAPREKGMSTGINGDQSALFSGVAHAGAAYVFVRTGSVWAQEAYVKPSNTGPFHNFTFSLALSGDRLLVGACREGSSATGVNGDQGDDGASTSGAAYVFDRSGTTWAQRAYLKASKTGAGDQFGESSALSGDTVIIGANREASSATGVNGDQSDDSALHAGAAYVFELGPVQPWTNMSFSLAGVTGIPGLYGTGSLAAGSSNAIDLINAAPSAPAGLFLALSGAPVPFKGGMLLPVPTLALYVLTTSAAGDISLPFVMPAGAPAGTELWLQYAILDAAAVQGVSLSSAIRGVTP
jgi:hypothetical protein